MKYPAAACVVVHTVAPAVVSVVADVAQWRGGHAAGTAAALDEEVRRDADQGGWQK